ncbi:MAG TPA: antibiotic biosynthesis monooxygenase [Caulobacteraceae bacterium]|nr:antibiotic biosynthesis monooxygenase [Caulobacteraceae bacterium]
MQEPGCLQFEIFQSALDPDRLTLLELWEDDAALAEHAKMNATRAPLPPGLIAGRGSREDYVHAPRG